MCPPPGDAQALVTKLPVRMYALASAVPTTPPLTPEHPHRPRSRPRVGGQGRRPPAHMLKAARFLAAKGTSACQSSPDALRISRTFGALEIVVPPRGAGAGGVSWRDRPRAAAILTARPAPVSAPSAPRQRSRAFAASALTVNSNQRLPRYSQNAEITWMGNQHGLNCELPAGNTTVRNILTWPSPHRRPVQNDKSPAAHSSSGTCARMARPIQAARTSSRSHLQTFRRRARLIAHPDEEWG